MCSYQLPSLNTTAPCYALVKKFIHADFFDFSWRITKKGDYHASGRIGEVTLTQEDIDTLCLDMRNIFKRSKEAYKLAQSDLLSNAWQYFTLPIFLNNTEKNIKFNDKRALYALDLTSTLSFSVERELLTLTLASYKYNSPLAILETLKKKVVTLHLDKVDLIYPGFKQFALVASELGYSDKEAVRSALKNATSIPMEDRIIKTWFYHCRIT